jgi:hypothetical protein
MGDIQGDQLLENSYGRISDVTEWQPLCLMCRGLIGQVKLYIILMLYFPRHLFTINSLTLSTLIWEPGSSGSTVSDYGLDDRAIEVRSPAGAKDFSSNLCVQTGSGAHPASCPMGTGGPFPGGKARPVRDADHSPPSSAEVVNE